VAKPEHIKSEVKCSQHWCGYSLENCPYCAERNWVYLGSFEDQSAPDAEAVVCYGCDKKFWLNWRTKDEFEMNNEFATHDEAGLEQSEDLIELAYTVKGTKSP
jgi:hypothetical protein